MLAQFALLDAIQAHADTSDLLNASVMVLAQWAEPILGS